jgi:ligand-binding sensor protein
LERFTIEVERRWKISLELLQNIQNVYIVSFSEKSQLNEKLMNFLEL